MCHLIYGWFSTDGHFFKMRFVIRSNETGDTVAKNAIFFIAYMRRTLNLNTFFIGFFKWDSNHLHTRLNCQVHLCHHTTHYKHQENYHLILLKNKKCFISVSFQFQLLQKFYASFWLIVAIMKNKAFNLKEEKNATINVWRLLIFDAGRSDTIRAAARPKRRKTDLHQSEAASNTKRNTFTFCVLLSVVLSVAFDYIFLVDLFIFVFH